MILGKLHKKDLLKRKGIEIDLMIPLDNGAEIRN
jgi:hypothetical protein